MLNSKSIVPVEHADSAVQNALHFESGVCHVHFAYDIGFAIDLDNAERHIRHAKQREFIRRTRKAPRYFQYHPPPLRVSLDNDPLKIGDYSTSATIDMVVYDFGAVTVIYRIPIAGFITDIQELGLSLYDNEVLLKNSNLQVQQLMNGIEPAITKPYFADLVEDYVVFQLGKSTPAMDPQQLLTRFALPLTQLLRAESVPLSGQEMADAMEHRIAFGTSDLTIIDWNAAFVLGDDMDDVLAVLEFANVELLEMRFLDDQLDRAQTQAYASFARRRSLGQWRPRSRATAMEDVARLQLDGAFLFESVNNTLKLLGDPYLARVYRLASHRFHLAEWDASILRKLGAVESIYSKISDQQGAWRMEVLEWIIILLIAISIIVSFR